MDQRPIKLLTISNLHRGFLLLFFLIAGCRGKVPADQVPQVPVDFSLNILLPTYSHLQLVGNYAYLDAGYRGIVLYRSGLDRFQAYDRACTYAPSQSCHKVSVVDSLMTMQCACCDSRFSLLDGNAIRGPAAWPLRTYRVFFDEISGSVRITN
ncbi:MAG: hypothetical protein KGQ39_07670 [Bacteroidetes bacterium]|nr:hypothetical protein [Bacteroidota bacterium]